MSAIDTYNPLSPFGPVIYDPNTFSNKCIDKINQSYQLSLDLVRYKRLDPESEALLTFGQTELERDILKVKPDEPFVGLVSAIAFGHTNIQIDGEDDFKRGVLEDICELMCSNSGKLIVLSVVRAQIPLKIVPKDKEGAIFACQSDSVPVRGARIYYNRSPLFFSGLNIRTLKHEKVPSKRAIVLGHEIIHYLHWAFEPLMTAYLINQKRADWMNVEELRTIYGGPDERFLLSENTLRAEYQLSPRVRYQGTTFETLPTNLLTHDSLGFNLLQVLIGLNLDDDLKPYLEDPRIREISVFLSIANDNLYMLKTCIEHKALYSSQTDLSLFNWGEFYWRFFPKSFISPLAISVFCNAQLTMRYLWQVASKVEKIIALIIGAHHSSNCLHHLISLNGQDICYAEIRMALFQYPLKTEFRLKIFSLFMPYIQQHVLKA